MYMIAITYPRLKNRLWFNAKATDSPNLINYWINIFDKVGLVKNIENKRLTNYGQLLRFSNLFEIIISSHIIVNRLISGTKLGKINFLIKSFGVTLGYLVLILAATNSSDESFIISMLLIIPLWSLMENMVIRISLSIVNSKGIIEAINIKNTNLAYGICLASLFEFIPVFITLCLVSSIVNWNLTLFYLLRIGVLALGLSIIFVIFGIAVSLKYYESRDQKFILPIIMKIILVLTPVLPITKEFNDVIALFINLNPATYPFVLVGISNLDYDLNNGVAFMSFVGFVSICTILIYRKRGIVYKLSQETGEYIVKRF
jgi:ABC-type polysaccharide/polyol phosphate export permease